jgi:hypothetical protein
MSRNLKNDATESEHEEPGSSDADLDLALRGFKGTPEEIDRQWFEKIYKGRGDTQKHRGHRARSLLLIEGAHRPWFQVGYGCSS